jgi:hypothetical protein
VSAKVSALSTYNRDMASPLLSSTSTSSLDRLKELSTAPSTITTLTTTSSATITMIANDHRPETETICSSIHEMMGTTTGDDTLTEISSIRSAGSSRISRFRRRSPAPPRKLFIVRVKASKQIFVCTKCCIITKLNTQIHQLGCE